VTGGGQHVKITGTEKFLYLIYIFFYFTLRENGLRRTLEPRKEEVVVKWRKLHNEELYNLYSP